MRARSGFSHAELLDREMGKDVPLVTPAEEAVAGGDRLLVLVVLSGFITNSRGWMLEVQSRHVVPSDVAQRLSRQITIKSTAAYQ